MAKTKASEVAVSDDDWRCEADLHALMEAEKIKADPKRYARAQALAKKKMMEVAKVASDPAQK
jgi:hypothetical protein